MCGICGFARQGMEDPTPFLKEMLCRVVHRGPNDEGRFIDEQMALGHRRLSIIDLSPAGHQPYFYGEDGRFVLVYNGEIYNYQELREELAGKGFAFSGQCDTEVLAAAYACWSEDCLTHLNGMFAFCMYDKQAGTLFCARDRFGVKPFYYTKAAGRFAFGSEIKQLLALPGVSALANQSRLAAFLVLGELDTTEETLFLDIGQLPPGGCLRYCLHTRTLEKRQWYHLEEAAATPLKGEDCAAIFTQQFPQAVQLRQRSDVPVGYCLSGGLDSSAIVATSARLATKDGFRPQCIHSISRQKSYDEYPFAKMVAEQAHADLHTVEADPATLFSELDEILWQMDEPFGSTSIYAQWYVFKKAKELGLTVMLDGQGADEQLAGYTPFVPVWLAEFLRHGDKLGYKTALASWNAAHATSATMVWRIQLLARLYTILPAKTAAGLLGRFATKPGGPFSATLKKQALAAAQPDDVTSGEAFIKSNFRHGLQALLHYEDRNSMAFSIESRVPFLDKNLVEALFPLPLNSKLCNGQSKSLMRQALVDILPVAVLHRQDKMGFVTPEAEWIKADPAAFRVELEAACKTLSPLLNTKRVLAWFDGGGGRTRGDFTLWRMICAGRWASVFEVKIKNSSL